MRLLQRFGPDALADNLTERGSLDLIAKINALAQRHLVDNTDRTASALVH